MSDNLSDRLKKTQKQSNLFAQMLEKFPDAEYKRGRWREFLCSNKANSQVNNVEFTRSCGCCSDAAILARPFYQIGGGKVYSDPFEFTIGFGVDFGSGIRPIESWVVLMRDAGIPENIITKCQEHLEKQENIPVYSFQETDLRDVVNYLNDKGCKQELLDAGLLDFLNDLLGAMEYKIASSLANGIIEYRLERTNV